ncbi:hypothetical protein JXA12_03835 [Candidatus Woesearchaeota archaeon]|nr:hypothetical protein [Candidatus Woesearchaeota archaeon]
MYLGVDESNHGRYPEIFVGAFTTEKKYTREGHFEKQRDNNRDFCLPYLHLIFTKEDAKRIGKKNFQLIAIAELARYVNDLKQIEKIFVDGDIPDVKMEALERAVHAINKKTRVLGGAHLDEKLLLVNEADNRANALYRYYNRHKDITRSAYRDHLIENHLERYQDHLLRTAAF